MIHSATVGVPGYHRVVYPKCRLPGSALGVTREACVLSCSHQVCPPRVTARSSIKEVVRAVMIGIDPHKRSHTAVAINGTDEVLGRLRVTADRRQLDRLLAFAERWPDRVWAVENASGLGPAAVTATVRGRRDGR